MCHVIGYAGRQEARPRLVDGLARLEFDAPECSGVCLLGGGGLELFRAVGRTETLRVRVNGGNGTMATAGIATTRGRVFEHPVVAGDVAVAFHGSISNRAPSLTDEELIAKLIADAYDGDLGVAVRAAYTQLEGHFAFLAMHDDEPGTVAAARRECILLAWIGEGEIYLTSSRAAFSGREVVPIESVSVASAAGLLVPA